MNRRGEEENQLVRLLVNVAVFILIAGALVWFFHSSGAIAFFKNLPSKLGLGTPEAVENSEQAVRFRLADDRLQYYDRVAWKDASSGFTLGNKSFAVVDVRRAFEEHWYTRTLPAFFAGPGEHSIRIEEFKKEEGVWEHSDAKTKGYAVVSYLLDRDYILNYNDDLYKNMKGALIPIGSVSNARLGTGEVYLGVPSFYKGLPAGTQDVLKELNALVQSKPLVLLTSPSLSVLMLDGSYGLALSGAPSYAALSHTVYYEVYYNNAPTKIYVELIVQEPTSASGNLYTLVNGRVLVTSNEETNYQIISHLNVDEEQVKQAVKNWRESKLKEPLTLSDGRYCVKRVGNDLVVELNTPVEAGAACHE